MPVMDLHEALAHISAIREQLSRTEMFRGFRSLTVGFSGLLAILTATVQSFLVPDPASQVHLYVGVWVGAAAISVTVCGAEMYWRHRRCLSPASRQLTGLAIGQFLPCVGAGAIMTTAMVKYAPDVAWLFPSLWATLFSLGIFATYRLLPRSVFWVAVYYLVCGVAGLSLGPERALSPWTMALTFGVGQLSAAVLLYWNLERHHVTRA